MEYLEKLASIEYITHNNPLCDNCARSNLEEIRIAAGLYAIIREITSEADVNFTKDILDEKINTATTF